MLVGFILVPVATLASNHFFDQNKTQVNELLNFIFSVNDHINFLSDTISCLQGNLQVPMCAKMCETIELTLGVGLLLKLVKVYLGSTSLSFKNVVV